MMQILSKYNLVFDKIHYYFSDVFLLFLRLYVADAFFRSGWLKFTSWDSTLYLFEAEYQVPFINFELAAYLATAVELVLPVLLVLGLATRGSTMMLFIFNIIAVISYPLIWENGFYDHKLWGIMLLVGVFYGAGKFSADYFICKNYQEQK